MYMFVNNFFIIWGLQILIESNLNQINFFRYLQDLECLIWNIKIYFNLCTLFLWVIVMSYPIWSEILLKNLTCFIQGESSAWGQTAQRALSPLFCEICAIFINCCRVYLSNEKIFAYIPGKAKLKSRICKFLQMQHPAYCI